MLVTRFKADALSASHRPHEVAETLDAGTRRGIHDMVGGLELLFAFRVSPYLYGALLVTGADR